MKASWWKYVLLALLTAGIVACGKDNKAGTSSTVVNGNPLTNGVSTPVTSSSFEEFKQQVINGQFVNQINAVVEYRLTEVHFKSSSWYLTGSYIYRRYDKTINFVEHEFGNDIASIHNKLIEIVNQGNNFTVIKRAASAYEIVTASGARYIIDLAKPLVVNPVWYKPADIQAEEGYTYNGSYVVFVP